LFISGLIKQTLTPEFRVWEMLNLGPDIAMLELLERAVNGTKESALGI
jgi:hypothetical protein